MTDRTSPQPNDDEIVGRIDAYFDRALDADGSARLFADLTRRPQALTSVVRQQAILDSLRDSVKSPDLKAAIFRDLGMNPAEQRYGYQQLTIWTRRISVAAAAALALCGGLWMRLQRLSPSPAPPAHSGPVTQVVQTISNQISPVDKVWNGVMDTARDIAEHVDQDRRVPVVDTPFPALTFPNPQWLRSFDPLHQAPSTQDVPTDVNISGLGPMAFV